MYGVGVWLVLCVIDYCLCGIDCDDVVFGCCELLCECVGVVVEIEDVLLGGVDCGGVECEVLIVGVE